ERRAIISLEQFRLKLLGFDPGSATNLTAAGQAIDRLMSQSLPDFIALIGRGGLGDLVAEFGISLQELIAIAESLDTPIIDPSTGRILTENFSVLADRIDLARQALTQFTDTLNDQRTLLEAERTIRGT